MSVRRLKPKDLLGGLFHFASNPEYIHVCPRLHHEY